MKLIQDLMIRAHIHILTTESAKVGVFAVGAAVGTALFVVSDPAAAAGFGTWGVNLKNELGGVVQGGLYAAYAGGLAITGMGINSAIEKNKNENSQIPTSSVAAKLFGGPALMALTYIADTMAESVGGSQATSQINRF